jgi:cystathionine beta-lyase/cystathionine gamma-synthase
MFSSSSSSTAAFGLLALRRLPAVAAAALRKTATSTSTAPFATKAGAWPAGNEDGAAMNLETKLVHSGVNPDGATGAVLTPIFLSTTFIQESVDKYLEKGFSYSRSGNPTVTTLEAKVAALENGFGATCVSTGMAATSTVIAATMKAGDHCVITDCSYGGTNRVCREHFSTMGMEFDFVDFRDPENVRKAIKPNTTLIFSESPTNPTLTICDIEAVSAIAKEHGCVHVTDSTFATPVICRPLDHGADLVIQSLTKYYDGHNMTVGGAVIAKTEEMNARIHHVQNMYGNIMSPVNAFLVLNTAKTMALRVRQQSKTAMAIAEYLEKHPKVTRVVYPGLASHPQKALADRYHRDGLHGGMLYFDVDGGDKAAVSLMDCIPRPWSLCENLGATESIITACAVMTHANMLREDRMKVGITDGFIRISCGIEDTQDLIDSLDSALQQI